MSYAVITDKDLLDLNVMESAVYSIRLAFHERSDGTLTSPPRFNISARKGNLVFTAGASQMVNAIGFRVYDTFNNSEPNHEQLVCVFDADKGTFKGVIIGNLLGAIRTGAIGGIAIDVMAKEDSTEVGIIGTGLQAKTQIEALLTVRKNIQRVNVYSRSRDNRKDFCKSILEKYNIEVVNCDSAQDCVQNADIVICATDSFKSVINVEWIKPGTHVSTVGPKAIDRHELPIEVAQNSELIATDSIDQLNSYKTPHFLSKAQDNLDIKEISDLVNQGLRRKENDISLFCSVGLSGTEVVVANEIINEYLGKSFEV